MVKHCSKDTERETKTTQIKNIWNSRHTHSTFAHTVHFCYNAIHFPLHSSSRFLLALSICLFGFLLSMDSVSVLTQPFSLCLLVFLYPTLKQQLLLALLTAGSLSHTTQKLLSFIYQWVSIYYRFLKK